MIPAWPRLRMYCLYSSSSSGVWRYSPSATGFSPTSLVAFLEPPASSASSVSRAQLFTLAASDGSTWKDLDGGLLLSVVPPADGSALLGGSADLWTDTAGYNQDLGLFVSTAGAADQLVAWKESGGSAPYSPNAVYVQAALPVTHGVAYTAKLKWKANRTASGVSIYAGAGTSGRLRPSPARRCGVSSRGAAPRHLHRKDAGRCNAGTRYPDAGVSP